MSQYNIHNIKFIDFQPKSINVIAYNKYNHKIAIGREDGAIEIYNIKNNMSIDFIIPGKDGRSVEHLEWFKSNRLFSSGLTGEIIEWNLETLKPKYQQDSYGGPVWYIKFNHGETKLAAGCEDGSIRLFNVEDDSLIYLRSLSIQAERVLSLSWDFNDEFIVSGGYGSICVYNVKNGQVITKMSPKHKTKEKTVVWAVEYLKHDYIVTGDSLGNTSFWCSNTYTLLASFKSHEADILAIAVSPDHSSVFSTGIDSKIVRFNYDEDEIQWKMVDHIKATEHDTRALICCNNEEQPFLVSGGVDPRFVVYPLSNYSSHESFIKYSCLTSNQKSCSLAYECNVIIFHDNHKVHGWKLGKFPGDKYKKIFEISSKDHCHILCSAISSDGCYVTYSTVSKTNIFEITFEDENYAIEKIDHTLPPSVRICFRNNEEILCAGFTKQLYLYNITTSEQSKINFSNSSNVSLPFTKITISKDGVFAAVCDNSQKIYIFDLTDGCESNILPALKGNITDMKFHHETDNLLIITSTRHFYEFDIKENRLLDWAKKITKRKVFELFGRPKHHILNLAINPKSVDEIFMQTKDIFGKLICNYNVDDIPDNEEMTSKKKRAKLSKSVLRVNHDYTDTVFFDFNSDGDIILAKHNLVKTLQNLPKPLKLKKFGE